MTTLAQDFGGEGCSADGALVLAFLAGDTEAFGALYRRYVPDLVRYVAARLGGDRATAEDLAQETMARALRHLHTFDTRRPLWPYLSAIASRVVAVECARRAHDIPSDGLLDAGERACADVVEAFVSREEVEACLARIPRRQRNALVMRYVEDRDPKDIALLFGLSRSAFEQLMWRARKNFADEYRTRNAALLPGFGALALRVRRALATLGTRLGAVTNAGFSVAGDVALGTALTIGGITVATGVLGGHAARPVTATVAPVASVPVGYTVASRPVVPPAGAAPVTTTGSAAGTAAARYPGHETVVGAAGTTAGSTAETTATTTSGGEPAAAYPATAPQSTTPNEPYGVAEPQDPAPPQPAAPQSDQEGEVTVGADTSDTTGDAPGDSSAQAEVSANPDGWNDEGTLQDTSIYVDTPGEGGLTIHTATVISGDGSTVCDTTGICL
jgi:RNA polymerase sigma-70 factor (ECF subfamily)